MWLETEFQGTWSLYQTLLAHAIPLFFSLTPLSFFLSTLSIPLSGSLCPSVCFVSPFPCFGLFFFFFFPPRPARARASLALAPAIETTHRAPAVAVPLAYSGIPGPGWGKGTPSWTRPGPGRASPSLAPVLLPPLPAPAGEEWPQCGPRGRRRWKGGDCAGKGATAGDVSEQESVCVCARF